jgi:predicted phosphoribosyltransferase
MLAPLATEGRMLGAEAEFADRKEAGRRLADAVAARALRPPLVVCALPRGGTPVAAEVARRLAAPLDLVLVRKLPAPGDPEYALGAVAEGDPPVVVMNPEAMAEAGAATAYVERVVARQLAEIERRRGVYFGGRARPPVQGVTAVVVDDGLATGSTARAAARSLRARGAARVILAVPVAPQDAIADLRGDFDEVVCVLAPPVFWGVGGFYREFHQLTDAEVVELLTAAAPGRKAD